MTFSTPGVAATWEVLFVFDVAIFLFTLVKSVREWKRIRESPSLFMLIFRDGMCLPTPTSLWIVLIIRRRNVFCVCASEHYSILVTYQLYSRIMALANATNIITYYVSLTILSEDISIQYLLSR